MMKSLLCPGLLETGVVREGVMAVRDGLVNLYVIEGSEGLLCVDAGWRTSVVARGFSELGLSARDVAAVLVTHLHWDHARCLRMFPDAEVFVSEHERPAVDLRSNCARRPFRKVTDGQMVMAAGLGVKVIGTPGHTHGSVSYLVEDRLLFTGDTLRLWHGKVRPFPSCFNKDRISLNKSIGRLSQIKGVECLLTAHNGVSCDVEDAFSPWLGSTNDSSVEDLGV